MKKRLARNVSHRDNANLSCIYSFLQLSGFFFWGGGVFFCFVLFLVVCFYQKRNIFVNCREFTFASRQFESPVFLLIILIHIRYIFEACRMLTLNCIRGYHGTQYLVFRLSHFNAAIFRANNFCNCLNSSCASFGEKKN